MNDNILEDIVRKTKLHFYMSVFREFEDSDRPLSIEESMLLEVIDYLDRPSINDLVNFLHISQPNMSYKVNVLVKKGYVRKVKNNKDQRFLHVVLTEDYLSYKQKKKEFTKDAMTRAEEKLNQKEIENLYHSLYLVDGVLGEKLEEYLKDYKGK
ncbi:MarR family winged helix-turn-helix transcriptional regulator [Anaerococcus prevotii]|uniref:Transcriptional regulator, MarR family n=1 Tax=Anaerococcus prevotii ACS-065-V-Col13 TaxID=879305 RepID=F0GTT1_9FIRM|nr:helix-turn-helix domain-containing protein [Anaerococcus prevotii]EGC82733.1 transcriptional regulator, MarR family [Anaerococcus prevotii ACS-065-V-Col13]